MIIINILVFKTFTLIIFINNILIFINKIFLDQKLHLIVVLACQVSLF